MQRAGNRTLAQKLVHSLPFLLALFAAFPFTLLFMILVASYWGYFDMGIGSAVNGFVLLYAYGPITLLFLLVLAAALSFALRRRVTGWVTLFAVLAAMALSVSGLFAAEAHRTKDYPGLRQEKSMGDFFRWLVHRWAGPHEKRPNPAIQPTAGRSDALLTVTSALAFQTKLALASGG